MKQVSVGIYECGYENIEVILREGDGGEFYFIPEKGKVPRIKIGADYANWKDVVRVLLHEVEEFSYSRLQLRYTDCQNMGQDHASYLFVFNHSQFTDACAKSAELMTACLPDLAKAWKKWQCEKKGK